jgi:hypothetical protein
MAFKYMEGLCIVSKGSIRPKKKETYFEGYVFVVRKFGPPLWIKLDFAIEHILIKDRIEIARVGIRNPCTIDSSTKNQVLYFNRCVIIHGFQYGIKKNNSHDILSPIKV